MKYDPFQKEAISFIQQGISVIVAAPTGAGKTVIAEHVIQDCLEKQKKVIYTSPIKALSNQKYREFSQGYPHKVGILTGDVTINQNASTLIMTTEIFRNKILEEETSLKDYAWIIFDEIHYLDDPERGSAWEESLIFLPNHMNVLGLSATIPNIDELAQWFTSIHKRPIKVIKEIHRPVPLHFFFQCQGKVYDRFETLQKEGFHSPDVPGFSGRRLPKTVPVKPSKPASLIKSLFERDMMPCIYFVFSRRRTEYLADEMFVFDFLTSEEKSRIREMYRELCERFDVGADAGTQRLAPFIERGIAYHHAGMLPTLKEVVERLFTSRLIKVIFTTETFALGINMPARTVIFDEMRKFYGRSFGPLKTRDFYQMAGRAGRRSIDTEGFVVCRVNPHHIDPEELRQVIEGTPEKVVSRFNASYATILNLYQQYRERLYDIYPLSFHAFQEGKQARKKARERLRVKVKLLKDLGHIRDNQLTDKGVFASKVYGYEFILSELFIQGTLEELSVRELALVSVSVVYEPRKGTHKPDLKRRVRQLEMITDQIMLPIQREERQLKIMPVSKRCFFHLSESVEAWLKGEPFDQILKFTDADEGEIVRYFRMAIQVLREVMDAPVSDELKSKMHQAICLINRDVIDSEKQLRS
jgi:superfamily II RNA helicase